MRTYVKHSTWLIVIDETLWISFSFSVHISSVFCLFLFLFIVSCSHKHLNHFILLCVDCYVSEVRENETGSFKSFNLKHQF